MLVIVVSSARLGHVCQRAAQRAIKGSGHLEAIAYVEKALGLLDGVGEDRTRSKLELDLHVTLGMPLIATRGYAAGDVERTYARARALSLQVGDTPQLPNIIWGLWVYYLTGGPLRSALEMAEQYSELAAAHPEDSSLALQCAMREGRKWGVSTVFVSIPGIPHGWISASVFSPTCPSKQTAP